MERRRIRKNETRKELSKTNRHARLITQYVQYKHPNIYEEAEVRYQELNDKYPHKRDLSKTIEFLQLTTGAVTYSQYYNQRKQERRAQDKKQTPPTETITTGQNDMPLLSLEMVQNIIPEVTVETVADSSDTCSSQSNTSDSENPPESVQDLMENPPESVQDIMENPPESVQDLIDEIINDPQLNGFFNDTPTPLETHLMDMGW